MLRGFKAPFNKDNWKAIALCLVTAFIFWFFNALNKNYTTRIEYPIRFDFNEDSLVAVSNLPRKIPVNVTGGGWNLLRKTLNVNANPISVNLDNPVKTQFLTQYSLMPIVSDHLDELTVNFVGIDTIYLEIDERDTRQTYVRVDTGAMYLAPNFVLASDIQVDPGMITLFGPKSALEQISDTIYIPLPDKEIDEDYNKEVPVSNFAYRLIESDPEKVRVNFDVVKYVPVTEEFYIERVNFPQEDGYQLTQNTVKVNFSVPADVKDRIESFDFSIIADFNNLMLSDSTIELEAVRYPDYVRNLEMLTERVGLVQVRTYD